MMVWIRAVRTEMLRTCQESVRLEWLTYQCCEARSDEVCC